MPEFKNVLLVNLLQLYSQSNFFEGNSTFLAGTSVSKILLHMELYPGKQSHINSYTEKEERSGGAEESSFHFQIREI